MSRETREVRRSGWGKWLIRSVGLGIAGAVAILILVAAGAKITGVNIGPVSLALEPQRPGQNQAGASSDLAVSTQTESHQAETVASNNQGTESCPYDADAFSLPMPQILYDEPSGSGYGIMYASDGFAVWIPNYYGDGTGDYMIYPASSVSPNAWIPLNDTPFSICADNSGQVFARFNA
jgi:hypothetical protein